MPGIVTVALFAFIASWNEFLSALIFMNKESSFTVPIMLVSVRAGRSQTSRDPVSDQIRKSTSPGFYGKLGAEFMLKSTFWLNTDLVVHQVFCADLDHYPRGWLDDNTTVVELRVGLNHYFRIRGNDAPAE